MITPLTVDDYIELVTTEHVEKQRFIETVSISASNYTSLQDVIAGFIDDFDLDIAIGVQLDSVGLWIGVPREINVPITGVYFSWDTIISEGWDNSIWKKKGDPDNTIVVLNDDDYRALLRSKILSNNWDGSIEQAYTILQTAFVSAPPITIKDNQNMTMTVTMPSTLTPVQIALVTEEYIVIRPSGITAIYNIV